jgi:hypothetical protein
MALAASPGSSFCMVKMTIDTPNNTGSAVKSRPTTYRTIPSPASRDGWKAWDSRLHIVTGR